MEKKLLFMKLPKTNRLLGLQVRGTVYFFQGSQHPSLARVYLVFPRNDPGVYSRIFNMGGGVHATISLLDPKY